MLFEKHDLRSDNVRPHMILDHTLIWNTHNPHTTLDYTWILTAHNLDPPSQVSVKYRRVSNDSLSTDEEKIVQKMCIDAADGIKLKR